MHIALCIHQDSSDVLGVLNIVNGVYPIINSLRNRGNRNVRNRSVVRIYYKYRH